MVGSRGWVRGGGLLGRGVVVECASIRACVLRCGACCSVWFRGRAAVCAIQQPRARNRQAMAWESDSQAETDETGWASMVCGAAI